MNENTLQKGRVAGIVCEYNPFHMGHKHQIDILREHGYDIIICAMSGNFTQRGELTIVDKYTRAEAALLCGADIVVELPFPFSSLSAEGFASSGVHILTNMGVDTLCFGSETADPALLRQAAEIIGSEAFQKEYANEQKSKGTARAYFDLLSKHMEKDISLLSNDILAISYIRAIREGGYKIDVFPIKREGMGYTETDLLPNTYPSAASLRRAVKFTSEGFEGLTGKQIPAVALNVLKNAKSDHLAPVFADAVEREILSFFSLMTPQEITARAVLRSGGGQTVCADSCGLTARLCNSAKNAHTLDELLANAYNAKYTDARVNRVLLYALFGVSDHFEKALPSFTTLLAANKIGCKHLAGLRKQSDFPIVTKPADCIPCSAETLWIAADAFYAKAMPGEFGEGYFLKKHPFILPF